MLSFAALSSLSTILFAAAQKASIPVPTMFAPYFPLLGLMAAAVVIEYILLWTGKSMRLNLWFVFAFVACGVALFVWHSWCDSVDIKAMIDLPGSSGTTFRLQMVAYGLVSLVIPVIMTIAAVKRCVIESRYTGVALCVVRTLPAVAVPILLFVYFRDAFRLFEGIDFQMFY